MLFSRLEFWVFFGFILACFGLSPKRFRHFILLAASYMFYATWDVRFLSLLVFSTVVDYFCGHKAYMTKKQLYVALSVICNLGLLATFKYFNFFVDEFIGFMGGDLTNVKPFISWGVPVGISFYTFQSMSYTLDCYRQKITPSNDPTKFALYVSFFPQLLAGPIERAFHLLPQLEDLSFGNAEQIKRGVGVILLGLFKKLFVANTLAGAIQYLSYENSLYGPEVLFLGIVMTFLVYCDFGAYSNIARGMALFFGIKLVVNFRPFYFAKNPSEFWKCWHISLTQWIRDYLFNPLARTGWGRQHLNAVSFFVMLVIGVWHGASLNWLMWGFCAGSFVVLYRYARKLKSTGKIPLFVKIIFSYAGMFLMYSLLGQLHLLQEDHLWSVFSVAWGSWSSWGEVPSLVTRVFAFASPLIAYDVASWVKKEDYLFERWPWPLQAFAAGVVLSSLVFLNQGADVPFIYYDF